MARKTQQSENKLIEALREYQEMGNTKGWDSPETLIVLQKHWSLDRFQHLALTIRCFNMVQE